MPEVKSKQFMVNIEPTLYVILQHVLNDVNMSASSYFRSLLIKDLFERKLLTEDVVLLLIGVSK